MAAEVATGLAVTDADRNRRREKRRRRLIQQKKAIEEDPIRNLIDKGEDPDFFGFPYIWVQIGHVVLGTTAIASAIVSGQGIEFALFDVQGEALVALRAGVSIAYTMNVFVAARIVYEELQIGEERIVNALGWGLKALLVGGVASWQRDGRLAKAKKEPSRRTELA